MYHFTSTLRQRYELPFIQTPSFVPGKSHWPSNPRGPPSASHDCMIGCGAAVDLPLLSMWAAETKLTRRLLLPSCRPAAGCSRERPPAWSCHLEGVEGGIGIPVEVAIAGTNGAMRVASVGGMYVQVVTGVIRWRGQARRCGWCQFCGTGRMGERGKGSSGAATCDQGS